MLRCEVTQLAFHEGRRVRPGEIVYLAGDKCPKWAKEAPKVAREVDQPVAKVAPRRGKAPTGDKPPTPPAGGEGGEVGEVGDDFV